MKARRNAVLAFITRNSTPAFQTRSKLVFRHTPMHISDLLHRALRLEWLTPEEGVFLFENASTAELMHVGNALRKHHVPGKTVTWIIDRNSNTTNVCIANCKFCNFYRRPGHEESYITTIDQYKVKIDLPSATKPTITSAAPNGSKLEEVNGMFVSQEVTLTSNQYYDQLDLGYIDINSSIGGLVFRDFNNNGSKETNHKVYSL